MDAASFDAAIQVLDQLWLVKAFAAVLGLAFAVWAITRTDRRWISFVALCVATVAASLAFVIE